MTLSDQIKKQFKTLLKEGEKTKRKYGWKGSNWNNLPPEDDYVRFKTQVLNLIKIA